MRTLARNHVTMRTNRGQDTHVLDRAPLKMSGGSTLDCAVYKADTNYVLGTYLQEIV